MKEKNEGHRRRRTTYLKIIQEWTGMGSREQLYRVAEDCRTLSTMITNVRRIRQDNVYMRIYLLSYNLYGSIIMEEILIRYGIRDGTDSYNIN